MDKKLNAIKQYFNDKTTVYIPIDINTSIPKIHDLLFDNILFDPAYTVEYLYLGYYHYNITKEYDLAKEYYGIAIDNGSTIGMINMANYYYRIEIDYYLMKNII